MHIKVAYDNKHVLIVVSRHSSLICFTHYIVTIGLDEGILRLHNDARLDHVEGFFRKTTAPLFALQD